jgi:hypothetical protein
MPRSRCNTDLGGERAASLNPGGRVVASAAGDKVGCATMALSRDTREVERAPAVAVAAGDVRPDARGRDPGVIAVSLTGIGRRRPRMLQNAEGLSNLRRARTEKIEVEVLASDLAQLLSTATRMLEPDPPTPSPDAALAPVLDAIDAARDGRTGLSFVPAVVRRLTRTMALSAAHDALLTAARRELIELRPEGGLGRLSAEELASCPPGPAGTRLSWVRRTSRVEK